MAGKLLPLVPCDIASMASYWTKSRAATVVSTEQNENDFNEELALKASTRGARIQAGKHRGGSAEDAGQQKIGPMSRLDIGKW